MSNSSLRIRTITSGWSGRAPMRSLRKESLGAVSARLFTYLLTYLLTNDVKSLKDTTRTIDIIVSSPQQRCIYSKHFKPNTDEWIFVVLILLVDFVGHRPIKIFRPSSQIGRFLSFDLSRPTKRFRIRLKKFFVGVLCRVVG